ncbi:hypothetical protein JZ751_028980 [Albula glossodonta]|uniref:Rho guanine nucleotide exchange factor 7 n=1 Tax=Albula glossodonta TaxID=121402 RepID=A0A8T2P595_9TELE|nr:hypothetical protein JZ751_028980 [Albula glossodonta]
MCHAVLKESEATAVVEAKGVVVFSKCCLCLYQHPLKSSGEHTAARDGAFRADHGGAVSEPDPHRRERTSSTEAQGSGQVPETESRPQRTFEANDLFQGQNFSKVLNCLVALNKSFDSLGSQPSLGRTSKLLQNQYRSLDMTENSNHQAVVKARFNFQQTNEDELSFSKGDIIHVTRVEEGGWWEGSLNGKTGWFPSNYKPVSPKSGTLKSPPKGFDTSAISKTYYNLEINTFQQTLVQSLEECTKLPEAQQRVGGFFLSLMPQIKGLYVAYCSNHPSAVNVLTEHSEELGEFMESKGASSPGILMLTTGLSKPFLRLDKYPTLLKELERHMEAQCQEVRKRKELQLQILTESIRCWEGDDIKTLGSVIFMSQVLIQNHGNEEKSERYLLLFPHVLLILSASPRMSGFIYQGKLPLTGMTISKLEDTETLKNTFEISGTMIDRIQVICNNQQDLQDWVDHLLRQTKQTTLAAPSMKPQSVPCHTLPSHPVTPSRHSESRSLTVAPAYHTLPHPSSHGTPHSTMMWGPLEPPKTQKPWSLSCLRPAPPLRPSAALCYKEDLSKSPKSMKKLLPKRKPERKPSDEEFALRKRSRKESGPHMLFPEEEKIIVEETRSNGQTVIEEKSLVDTVYALKDEVQELKLDYKKMKRTLEEEQKARKELEKIVKKVLKSMNDPSWDETNL